MRRLLLPVLVLAVLTVGACTSDDGQPTGVIEEEAPMPTIEAETLDGGTASTADLAGSPSVVNVWATWCAPCQAELPALVDVATAYDGRVGFLGVNYVDNAAAAFSWEKDYGLPYPSLDDASGTFADDLGFPYLPHTLVVDAGGTIRYRIFGETTEEELSGLLDELLAEASAA